MTNENNFQYEEVSIPPEVIEVPERVLPADPEASKVLGSMGSSVSAGGPSSGNLSFVVDQLGKLTLGGFFVLIAIVSGLMLATGAWFSSSVAEDTAQKTTTYQNLTDKITEQNNKIDILTNEVDTLTNKINENSKQTVIPKPIK